MSGAVTYTSFSFQRGLSAFFQHKTHFAGLLRGLLIDAIVAELDCGVA